MKDIHVFHSLKALASVSPGEESDLFYWQTCLRFLAFYQGELPANLSRFHNEASAEVLKGELAYQRLLEIICGCHSPLFGETEVMGQFKKLVLEENISHLSWSREARRFLQGLLADAKLIRQKYMIGLGSQSYGSLVRKRIKPFSKIAILGFGQLGQEILPWVEKSQKNLTVFARHLEQKKDATVRFSGVEFLDWNKAEISDLNYDVIVVAAPLLTPEISAFISSLKTPPKLIIDFRAESRLSPLENEIPQVKLHEVFSEVEKTKHENKKIKAQVLKEIEQLTQKRFESFDVRPFGWEDICA